VSARLIMQRALMALGLDETSEVANEEYWINQVYQAQVDMRLATAFELKVNAPIKIENCYASKPPGYVILVKMTLADASGRNVVTPWFRPLRDTLMATGCPNGHTRARGGDVSVSEQPYGFEFSSNVEGLYMHVTYRGYAFDLEGYPLVDTRYENAIIAYARWRWIIRSRSTGLRTFTINDEDYAKKEYADARIRARSLAVTDGMTDDIMEQLSVMWNDPRYRTTSRYQAAENNNNVLDRTMGVPVSTDGNMFRTP